MFDSNVYYGHVAAPDDPHALTADPQFSAPGTGALAGRRWRGTICYLDLLRGAREN